MAIIHCFLTDSDIWAWVESMWRLKKMLACHSDCYKMKLEWWLLGSMLIRYFLDFKEKSFLYDVFIFVIKVSKLACDLMKSRSLRSYAVFLRTEKVFLQ